MDENPQPPGQEPQHQTAILTNPPEKKHHVWLWGVGVALVAVLVGGGGFWYWQSLYNSSDEQGAIFTSYDLVNLNTNCNYDNNCDEQLVAVDEEGNRTVIVENITQLFKRTQLEDPESNTTIEKFYFPPGSKKLFFNSFIPSSSGCCRIIAFDIEAKEFVPLVNGYFDPYFARDAVSPDNSKIARLDEDGKVLMVVDVLEDSTQVVSRAGEGETLRSHYESYGASPVGVIKWLDNSRIEYEVFLDKDQDSVKEITPRKSIEVRVVDLSEMSATTTFQASGLPLGADPNTYEDLGGIYSRDELRVYAADEIHDSGFIVLLDADPGTFVAEANIPNTLKGLWARDKMHLFWTIYDVTPEAGFHNLDLLQAIDRSGFYMKDDTSVYTHGAASRKYKEIQDADPNTFLIVEQWEHNIAYAKDARSVFFGDQVLAEADPNTFMALGYTSWNLGYGKDKSKVYFQTQIVSGADPTSFVKVTDQQDYDAQDKNHKYLRGEIVE